MGLKKNNGMTRAKDFLEVLGVICAMVNPKMLFLTKINKTIIATPTI